MANVISSTPSSSPPPSPPTLPSYGTALDQYCEESGDKIRCRICEQVLQTGVCQCNNYTSKDVCDKKGCYWNVDTDTCTATALSPLHCPFVGWPAELDSSLKKRTCLPMQRMLHKKGYDGYQDPIFVEETGLPCGSSSIDGYQPCEVIAPMTDDISVATSIPRDMGIKFVKHSVDGIYPQDGNGCSYDTYSGRYSWDYLLPAKAEYDATYECPQTDSDCLRCPTNCAKDCPTNCAKDCPAKTNCAKDCPAALCAPSLLWLVIVFVIVSVVAIAIYGWLSRRRPSHTGA